MPVASDSLLYADDTCIVFQYKNVTEIEKQPLSDFSSLYDWFVFNTLSVHFGQKKKNPFYLVLNTNFKMLWP